MYYISIYYIHCQLADITIHSQFKISWSALGRVTNKVEIILLFWKDNIIIIGFEIVNFLS